MKRDWLKELGLEKEVVDKIMEENGKDIEAAKGKKDDYETKIKELEEERDKLNDTIKERDTQLETLKTSAGDNAELKKKIDELTSANQTAKETHEKEMAALKKNHAIESALAEAKVKSIKAAMPFIDTDKVSVDGNNLLGLTEQINKLKEDEATKFLFDSGKPSMKGAKPGEGGDPGDKGYTRDDIRKMSYPERMKLFNEDPEAYKAAMGEE